MKRHLLQAAVLCGALTHASFGIAANGGFSFGFISHPVKSASDDSALRDAIEESDADNLAFVVANGMKAAAEPCTDKVYSRRKALLQNAKNGLVISLAASDWAECKTENGKPAASGKLTLLRDLLFFDEFSLGATRIPVVRQSASAKFRSFVENARWEIGDIVFATINLPANNNHYVTDAGRNSEFEDRLVANRDWLNRLFTYAARREFDGIVLFCDGNPLARPVAGKRDGYAETRRLITTLAAKFPGKVLIVHGQSARAAATPAIDWRGNLGNLGAGSGWIKLNVSMSHPALFTVANDSAHAANGRQ